MPAGRLLADQELITPPVFVGAEMAVDPVYATPWVNVIGETFAKIANGCTTAIANVTDCEPV